MDQKKSIIQVCPHCRSSNLRLAMDLHQVGDGGGLGLQYEATDTMFYKLKNEPMLVDLCLDCGTIVRFFINEPKRKWIKR